MTKQAGEVLVTAARAKALAGFAMPVTFTKRVTHALGFTARQAGAGGHLAWQVIETTLARAAAECDGLAPGEDRVDFLHAGRMLRMVVNGRGRSRSLTIDLAKRENDSLIEKQERIIDRTGPGKKLVAAVNKLNKLRKGAGE